MPGKKDGEVQVDLVLNLDQNKLNKAQKAMKELDKSLKGVKDDSDKAEDNLDGMGDSANRNSKAIGGMGNALKGLAGIIAGLKLAQTAFDAGKSFESAFAGVKKTVNATEQEFNSMREQILALSTEIPVTADELASIGETAGQLGIRNKDIVSFSKTMAELGVATNLTSEEAATMLARFANITKMPQKDFDRLGSTIVALGNNFATTEAEITEMSLRIAGAGNQVGLTEAQIAGVAAALSSVGIEADAGGTAISKLMINIASSVSKGGDKLNKFAKAANMSVKEFKKSWNKDAGATITKFFEGLGKSGEQGKDVLKIIDQLGIKEVRLRDAVLRASGSYELFGDAQRQATEAWRDNIALENEANQRFATTDSMMQKISNTINVLFIRSFDALKPTIDETLKTIFNLTSGLKDFVTGLDPKQVKNFADVLIGLGAGNIALKGLNTTFGTSTRLIDLFFKTSNRNTTRSKAGYKGLIGTVLGLGRASENLAGTTSEVSKSASQNTGILSGLGSIIRGLNPVTIGAAVGIGALAFAFDKLTEPQRIAAEQMDNFGKKIVQAGEEATKLPQEVQASVDSTINSIEKLNANFNLSQFKLGKSATGELVASTKTEMANVRKELLTNIKRNLQVWETYETSRTDISKKQIQQNINNRVKEASQQEKEVTKLYKTIVANSKIGTDGQMKDVNKVTKAYEKLKQITDKIVPGGAGRLNDLGALAENGGLNADETKEYYEILTKSASEAIKKIRSEEANAIKLAHGDQAKIDEIRRNSLKKQEAFYQDTYNRAKKGLSDQESLNNLIFSGGQFQYGQGYTGEQKAFIDNLNEMTKNMSDAQKQAFAKMSGEFVQFTDGQTTEFYFHGQDVTKTFNQGMIDGLANSGAAMQKIIETLGTDLEFKDNEWYFKGQKLSKDLIDGLKSTPLNEIEQYLKDKLNINPPDLKDKGKDTGKSFSTGIKSSDELIQKAAQTAINGVKDAKPPSLNTLGKNTGQGFADGLRGSAGSIGDATDFIASLVPSGIKKLLGIHSPSKVTEKLGIWTGKGFIEGITRTYEATKQVATNLANGVVNSFKKAVNNAGFQQQVNKNRLQILKNARADALSMSGLTEAEKEAIKKEYDELIAEEEKNAKRLLEASKREDALNSQNWHADQDLGKKKAAINSKYNKKIDDLEKKKKKARTKSEKDSIAKQIKKIKDAQKKEIKAAEKANEERKKLNEQNKNLQDENADYLEEVEDRKEEILKEAAKKQEEIERRRQEAVKQIAAQTRDDVEEIFKKSINPRTNVKQSSRNIGAINMKIYSNNTDPVAVAEEVIDLAIDRIDIALGGKL